MPKPNKTSQPAATPPADPQPGAGEKSVDQPPDSQPAATPTKTPSSTTVFELRKELTIQGRTYPVGTVVGSVITEPPFSANFLIDGARGAVCGKAARRAAGLVP